jgi:hypothetical protein
MNGGLSMCKTQVDDGFLCCMSELHVDRVDRVAFVTHSDLEYDGSLQMKLDKKERNLLAVPTGWD